MKRPEASTAMWADDVGCSRETDHVRGMVANSPTMDTLMETRRCRWLKLSAMEESRSPGECLAHGVRRQDQ
jgi:hypothetical protein